MKPFYASSILAGLLCLSLGCPSKSSVEELGPEVQIDSAAASPADSVDRAADIAAAVEAVAKTRRDGNDAVIEVDLRDADVTGVLEKLSGLPKLRSVLLSGSNVDDSGLISVAKIESLQNLDLRGCAVGDAGIAHLGGLKQLNAIKFSGKDAATQVTDAAMKTLAGIKTLEEIALDFLPITDRGVAALGGLPKLSDLYLAGTQVTDEAAQTLASFSALKKLRIASTPFGNDGLAELAGLTQLVELDLSECAAIDDAALGTLGGFAKLSKLNLYATSVGDGDWGQLAGATKLQWLNVDKTNVGDSSLQALGKLTSLTFLHLGSTQITDAGLPQLAGLSKLEKLIVTRTAVTQAGVDQLQPQLPETEIQLEYVPGK